MTSEMMRVVKLPAPETLPPDTYSSADFKVWRSHVVTYLTQNSDNCMFIKGGDYEAWEPQTTCLPNKRLAELKGDDLAYPTRAQVKAQAMQGAEPDYVPNQEELDSAKLALQKRRLVMRNSQLGLLLQQISACCYKSERWDIVERSDSVEWVWQYLMSHYNIEARGANILKIADKTFPAGGNYMVFYKEFRLMILDNLRLKGSKADPRIAGDKLAADEKLSPSFEDIIIIWTLERIDRRLPAKVRKDYEHRLYGDTFLWDLQSVIFQAIPAMLDELAKEDNFANALGAAMNRSRPAAAAPLHQQLQALQLCAGFTRPNKTGKGGNDNSNRGRQSAAGGPWTEMYCRICHKIRKQPKSVFTGHNTNQCSSLSVEDRYCLLSELQVDWDMEEQYENDIKNQDGDQSQEGANGASATS